MSTPLGADSNAVDRIDSILPDTILPSVLATNADSDSVLVVPAANAPQLQKKSRIVNTKVDLDAPVIFTSADSMTIVRRDSAFMYGNSSVTYGDIKLDAAEIQMDLNHNTVFALGRPDSTGEITGKPIFTENGTDYEAATMNYNFKTSKGYRSEEHTSELQSP